MILFQSLASTMQANPSIRALSVVTNDADHLRLQRAGAETLCPSKIGGRRMASELLRPVAATLLDRMLASSGAVRFEAVTVNESNGLAGLSLAKANLFARTGLRVLAIRNPGSRSFTIRPTPETVLDPGTILIVTGPASRAWPSATRPPSGLAATQWMGNARLPKQLGLAVSYAGSQNFKR